MPQTLRVLLALTLGAVLAGCAPPRGAALQSEVLAKADAEDASFQVVPVTREALPAIQHWPATGLQVGWGWVNGSRTGGSPAIAVGDLIDITVWDSQQNSLLTADAEKAVTINQIKVTPAGTIFVPYVGDVLVRGRTPEQARADIQMRMEPIVPAAQVLLQVTPGAGNTVDLVSGVVRPGRYPLVDRSYTILSLIADGGGIAPGLRNPVVRLQRGGRSVAVPAETQFRTPAHDTVLRGGDRVVVEQDPRYFVALGATGREQIVWFDKQQLTALDALAAIGGLSENRANLKGVMVLREYPAKALRLDGRGPQKQQVIFTLDLTSADGLFAARQFRINPEDVVLATESPIPAISSVIGMFRASVGLGRSL
ncbi:MAG: polysaccharide biosynthesis/export family protein [Gemmobacter sp.]